MFRLWVKNNKNIQNKVTIYNKFHTSQFHSKVNKKNNWIKQMIGNFKERSIIKQEDV